MYAYEDVKTNIIKRSHHFVVKNPRQSVKQVLYQLLGNYTQFEQVFNKETRKVDKVPSHTYGIYVDRGQEFRLHIGLWDQFWLAFRNIGLPEKYWTLETQDLYEAAAVKLGMKDSWVLTSEQGEAVDWVFDEYSKGVRNPLFYLPVGTGKTVMSGAVADRHGYRLGVVVLKKYVKKWIQDCKELFNVSNRDILVVESSDDLKSVTTYPERGYPLPKIIIFSMQTLAPWFKAYEQDPSDPVLKEEYGCEPGDLYETLKIGTVLVDETHEYPHLVYKVQCYMHVPLCLSMTGTLLSKDPVLQRVQALMFPHNRRYDAIEMKRYINVHASQYQIVSLATAKIKTSYRGNMYSHAAFEESILNHKTLRKQFITMVVNWIKDTFMVDRDERDKAAVYVATKEMAIALQQALVLEFPDLDTRVYMQGDPYENALEPHIRIATIIKGGTGLDIPNLRHVYLTVSIDSPNANVQVMGRLRELDKGQEKQRSVHFHYLYTNSIDKQLQYHLDKKEHLVSRSARITDEFLGVLYP